MDSKRAANILVTLDLDAEQIPLLLSALAFLADQCVTRGIDGDGHVFEDKLPENKHFGEALNYVTYIAAQIGEAILDN